MSGRPGRSDTGRGHGFVPARVRPSIQRGRAGIEAPALVIAGEAVRLAGRLREDALADSENVKPVQPCGRHLVDRALEGSALKEAVRLAGPVKDLETIFARAGAGAFLEEMA
jgi:hypothetical protein